MRVEFVPEQDNEYTFYPESEPTHVLLPVAQSSRSVRLKPLLVKQSTHLVRQTFY